MTPDMDQSGILAATLGSHWSAVAEEAVRDHHAIQKPAELADLLAVAAQHDVELVLEIGADAGGTLWAWRQLPADVIAVSLQSGPFSSERGLVDHGATVIEGDSHSLETWLRLQTLLDGRKADMLFVDGDHTTAGVEADVMAYSGFVRSGGLVALHDICEHPNRQDVGVHNVWNKLTASFECREIVHHPTKWAGIGVATLP